MKYTIPLLSLMAVVIAACAGRSGTWVPGCPIHEGDRITLEGDTFVWDRFTDEVVVDVDGTHKDLFPDYPKSGTFMVDGERLVMTTDAGVQLPDMHFVEIGSSTFLLTSGQLERFRNGAGIDACALTLGAD